MSARFFWRHNFRPNLRAPRIKANAPERAFGESFRPGGLLLLAHSVLLQNRVRTRSQPPGLTQSFIRSLPVPSKAYRGRHLEIFQLAKGTCGLRLKRTGAPPPFPMACASSKPEDLFPAAGAASLVGGGASFPKNKTGALMGSGSNEWAVPASGARGALNSVTTTQQGLPVECHPVFGSGTERRWGVRGMY